MKFIEYHTFVHHAYVCIQMNCRWNEVKEWAHTMATTSYRIEIKFKLVLQVKLHENGLNAENYEINSLLIEFSVLYNFQTRLWSTACAVSVCVAEWVSYLLALLKHFTVQFAKFCIVISFDVISVITHAHRERHILQCKRYWWKPKSWRQAHRMEMQRNIHNEERKKCKEVYHPKRMWTKV